jgi:dTDP-D-glucose 4,6-dehydratase
VNRRTTPLQAIALRLANVYGGENDHRERLVPSIVTQAMAHRTIQIVGGSQNVSFLLRIS